MPVPAGPPEPYHWGEIVLKAITILVLGGIVMTAIAGLTVTAVLTDRDLRFPEELTFAGVVLIAVLGGLTWLGFHRRRRWHVEVDHNGRGGPLDV
jgi:hypothetical protein